MTDEDEPVQHCTVDEPVALPTALETAAIEYLDVDDQRTIVIYQHAILMVIAREERATAAQEFTVELWEEPSDGLPRDPDDLVTAFLDELLATTDAVRVSPVEIDMWTLHSGATYALTHFFQGKEGASLDGYVRTANDILFNPEGTIERVERASEGQLQADEDESQASLAGERALASIGRVSDDRQEKVEQFEEREDALREQFQDAMG